jgi:prepilin signal peptidase PulO-like enzyme (type II secretory pathway)
MLTGVLFVLTAVFLLGDIRILPGFSFLSFALSSYYYLIVASLIVIIFTDIKYGIIPFKVIAVTVVAAVIYALFSPMFLNYLLSALGVFALFLALFLITRGRGLGFGDVVYAFMMGFVLGYPNIIVGLYVAFLTGAIVSLILVWTGKKKMKGDSIPFGPFLVAGTLLGLFWGDQLISLALSYLLI